ncbi:cysteine desulfurase family protein [Lactovum miscens]|uniref:Cysteine desulfurase n=1 Tax=Lactovum miscens TaxID=190387 RepID=A0A841C803_9LACT|nr:cysteine desulfurase family protein [Lactovum miscens]MBB5887529.1 cysteine desulfurase [Lactovum miscens]
MIYFDNAATTAMTTEVLKSYNDVVTRVIGNPSSLHNLGTVAGRLLNASRRQISDLLNVSPDEIFFTSGGSESDNWIIKGTAFEKQAFGKHLIISSVEHPAIKNSAEWLRDQGFKVDYAPVDKNGFVLVDELEKLICEDTILVSVMAVNNEVGAIQPLKEIATLLGNFPKISFHVDAVQAIGKIATKDFLLPRVDFASFSAHKFHGPRGVGFNYIKSGKRLTPLIHGGGQESGKRSTTENLPGIVATAKALRISLEGFEEKHAHVAEMKKVIYNELKEHNNVLVFSGVDNYAANILTWGIKGIRGEVTVHAFEDHEIYISTTSACASRKNSAAGTLMAMKVDPKLATSAVRISLDYTNTMTEVELFLTVFRQVLLKLG